MPINKQKRVLCLFDYIARTGFGTVSKNIVAELKKNFGSELHMDIIAINYFGEEGWQDDNTYVIPATIDAAKIAKVLGTDAEPDLFGRNTFLKRLQDYDYDGVFICQDLGIIQPIIEVMEHVRKVKKEQSRKNFKSIFYFPVDCVLNIPQLVKGLEFFDILVTYTEFSRNEVTKLRPELKGKIKVVPHGNNSNDFYPLPEEERIAFRKEYFGENAGKFIINNTNRNQVRKDIPNTIFGFIEVKEIWGDFLPKPFLYLHMHPSDPKGNDLRAILNQTKLVEDVDYKLLPKEYELSGCDTETLNKIYNASDVYLTTSLAEGWGLGFSECAACKIPIVAPYSTSFMEMSGYGKNAYMLTTLYPYCGSENIIRQQTDIYEIADTLLQVAKDKYSGSDELKGKIERNYQWVKKLEWKDVCKSWVEFFKIF